MVLVPGPHFLNSALDLIAGRVHLGGALVLAIGARLIFVSTCVTPSPSTLACRVIGILTPPASRARWGVS
jgi:hypothetical protein